MSLNRAMRRRQAREQKPSYAAMTAKQRKDALFKNGITADDLKETAQENYNAGWKDACDYCMKVCYAAAILALHDLEGYGATRNIRFLRAMDSHVTNTLSSDEIIDEAFRQAGVAVSFTEPLERVMPVS